MTSETKMYIKPNEFFDEMLVCLRNGEASNRLGEMYYKLSEKYCNHWKFNRYSHIREDMIGTGLIACMEAFEKFEPYNKFGLAIHNGLLEQDQENPSVFRYQHNGEEVEFHFDESKEHRPIIMKKMDQFLEDEELITWDGEELAYDHKICNNPFAFYTTVINNALIQYLKKEYNQRNIINKVKISEGQEADFGYLEMIEKKVEEEKRKKEEEVRPEEADDHEEVDNQLKKSMIQW